MADRLTRAGVRGSRWRFWFGVTAGVCRRFGLSGSPSDTPSIAPRFGFSAGFRAFLRDGRTAHVRAQLLMVGIAALLFLPALAAGTVLGQPVRGFVFPAGAGRRHSARFCSASACSSAAAARQARSIPLAAAPPECWSRCCSSSSGATIAAFYAEWWSALPTLPPVSLLASFGLLPSLLFTTGASSRYLGSGSQRTNGGAIGQLASIWRRADGGLSPAAWPYAWAALALAIVELYAR